MGIRLLLLLFLAWLIWWVFKPLFQPRQKTAEDSTNRVEDMVRCSYCQVNIPKPDALEEEGHFFCNEAHQRDYHSRQ